MNVTDALSVLHTVELIGLPTWGLLILADTVLGIVVRSGSGGKFDPKYLGNFLQSNFATTQFKAMAGLAGGALVSALTAHVLSGQADTVQLLGVLGNAAQAAFVAGVATQDTALISDITKKLRGKSVGQLARKPAPAPVPVPAPLPVPDPMPRPMPRP